MRPFASFHSTPRATRPLGDALTSLLLVLCTATTAVLSGTCPPPSSFPPLDQVHLGQVSHSGTGCPLSSEPSLTVSMDVVTGSIETFTILSFPPELTISPSSNPGETIRQCNVNIGLEFPSGWSLAIVDSEWKYPGEVELSEGYRFTQKSVYTFSGAPDGQNKKIECAVDGFYSDEFSCVKAGMPDDELVWSPCNKDTSGATLTVYTEEKLQNIRASDGFGLVAVEVAAPFSMVHVVKARWKRC